MKDKSDVKCVLGYSVRILTWSMQEQDQPLFELTEWKRRWIPVSCSSVWRIFFRPSNIVKVPSAALCIFQILLVPFYVHFKYIESCFFILWRRDRKKSYRSWFPIQYLDAPYTFWRLEYAWSTCMRVQNKRKILNCFGTLTC